MIDGTSSDYWTLGAEQRRNLPSGGTMLHIGSTKVWVVPEAALADQNFANEVLTRPAAVRDISGLAKFLNSKKADTYSTFGDACLENDTLVFLPRDKSLLDRQTQNPQVWVFTGGLLGTLAAAAADKVLTKPTPREQTSKDALAKAVFAEPSRCPEIEKKLGIDLGHAIHVRNPFVLVTASSRNTFEKLFEFGVHKSACLHVFVGEIRLGEKVSKGLLAYGIRDTASYEKIQRTFEKEGISSDRIREVAPIDLRAIGGRA